MKRREEARAAVCVGYEVGSARPGEEREQSKVMWSVRFCTADDQTSVIPQRSEMGALEKLDLKKDGA